MSGCRLRLDGGGRRLMGGMGWRTEDAGRSAEVVVPLTVYEWGNRGEGDLKLWDALL